MVPRKGLEQDTEGPLWPSLRALSPVAYPHAYPRLPPVPVIVARSDEVAADLDEGHLDDNEHPLPADAKFSCYVRFAHWCPSGRQ